MSANFDKIIEKVNSGKLTRKELENLRKNAINKGGADTVVAACDTMLATLPKSRSGGTRQASTEIAEKRNSYNIMASAYDSNINLIKPELVEIAELHATNNLVTDISILKTQIKLYYKGRHFTSGSRPTKGVFWIACLDETKITNQTIECWKKLGKIVGGKYFATRYIAVEVDDLYQLHTAFDCVAFT